MLVLLDRDGVINKDLPTGVYKKEMFIFLPRSLEALRLLHENNIKIAVATNQSVVGKGLCSEGELRKIHQYMLDEVKANGGLIEHIYYCADHPDNPTKMRKPEPGMLQKALTDFNYPAGKTPMIGDSKKDIDAAHKAGCPAFLVKTGKGTATLTEMKNSKITEADKPDKIFNDLMEAAIYLTKENQDLL